jgi:hypothetical protein
VNSSDVTIFFIILKDRRSKAVFAVIGNFHLPPYHEAEMTEPFGSAMPVY